MRRLQAHYSKSSRQFVLPLFGTSYKTSGRPSQFYGSSFLIKVRTSYFLVTAGHVMNNLVTGKTSVFSVNGNKKIVEIQVKNYVTAGDIAVIEVTGQPVLLNQRPMQVVAEPIQETSDGLQLISGYPHSLNKKFMSNKYFTPVNAFVTQLIENGEEPANSFKRRASYSRDQFVDDLGDKLEMTAHPNGMSGASSSYRRYACTAFS